MSDTHPLPDPAVADAAAAMAEAPMPDAPETPEAAIARLTAERDDMRDRWMRAEAENANIRQRAKRDMDDTRQYAVQKFATDVVEAANNLRAGLQSIPAPTVGEDGGEDLYAKLRDGFEGVERAFVALLERNGIQRQDPTGLQFDPNLHQAMAEQPSADQPAGTVLQSWTPAWTLHGRLLRPAMVVVAKAQPEDSAA